MTRPTAAAQYERRLRDRHGDLVDLKFLRGLTEAEANELAALNGALDAIEEPFYRPIKVMLRRTEQEVREAQS